MTDAALAARGVYKPQRSRASPLFRLVPDHLQHGRGEGRAEARSPALARRVTTVYTRPSPIEFPIPDEGLGLPGVSVSRDIAEARAVLARVLPGENLSGATGVGGR